MENDEDNHVRGEEELPLELVDPITLTLMVRAHHIWLKSWAALKVESLFVQEDPIMLTHFSAESIAAWMRLQAQAKTQCPVCKIGISPDQPPVPNWTLRNIIHQYREKHGEQLVEGSSGVVQVQIDLNLAEGDPLLKPSDRLPLLPCLPAGGVGHTPRLASKPRSSKKKPKSKKSEGAPPAYSLTLGSSSAPLINTKAGCGQGQAQAGGDNDSSCECCLPKGPRGCCVWECDECGVCRVADDCKGDCWCRFPVTTLTCQVSFGKWSNWCTRTICGLIYPLWVPLVLCLMVCDQLLMMVVWSLWILGLFFFKLTWYFCPSFNQWVDARLSPESSFLGEVWLSMQ